MLFVVTGMHPFTEITGFQPRSHGGNQRAYAVESRLSGRNGVPGFVLMEDCVQASVSGLSIPGSHGVPTPFSWQQNDELPVFQGE